MALAFLFIVISASAVMIVMNYYTIRILSAARAYINGESEYSKGQKDASAHLINYIYLENDLDYKAFEREISVPEGDQKARIAISLHNDLDAARKGFLQGKNHPQDIENVVWLFNTFQHFPKFNRAVTIWQGGDLLINKLHRVGLEVRQKLNKGSLTAEEKKMLILEISAISQQLTKMEDEFSDTLGSICRDVNVYVFVADVIITLVIIISSLSYAWVMIHNLNKSNAKIVEQNDHLQVINAGLDKFVFNITHDLRSPLVALIGLIDLIDEETDQAQIKVYMLMMKESLEKQDNFINEMLTFIKSKHTGLVKKECQLELIIDNVIAQNHNRNGGRAIQFIKEIKLNEIHSDSLKLQVILNNLVSNSIKYADPKKDSQWVKIATYQNNGSAVIEVEDNGLGIRPQDKERIFDKFYLYGANKRSSGLGLYLVKDAVTQMEGRIEVRSEIGKFSCFTITIPSGN
jgi:signal transduction histidine kinase